MTSRGGGEAAAAEEDKYLARSFHDGSQRLSDAIRSTMEQRERSWSGSCTPASSVRCAYWSRSEPHTMSWNRLEESAREEMSRARRYRAFSSMSSAERVSKDMGCRSRAGLGHGCWEPCCQATTLPRPCALRLLALVHFSRYSESYANESGRLASGSEVLNIPVPSSNRSRAFMFLCHPGSVLK